MVQGHAELFLRKLRIAKQTTGLWNCECRPLQLRMQCMRSACLESDALSEYIKLGYSVLCSGSNCHYQYTCTLGSGVITIASDALSTQASVNRWIVPGWCRRLSVLFWRRADEQAEILSTKKTGEGDADSETTNSRQSPGWVEGGGPPISRMWGRLSYHHLRRQPLFEHRTKSLVACCRVCWPSWLYFICLPVGLSVYLSPRCLLMQVCLCVVQSTAAMSVAAVQL